MASGNITAPIALKMGNYEVAGNSSKTFTVGNSTRGFFVTSSNPSSTKSIGIFHVISSGTASVLLLNSPSGISASAGTNSVTIANESSAVLYVTFFMTVGNPPT